MMRARTEQELIGIFTMAALIEARDPYTVGHAWRVSRYARLIAENSVQTEAVIAQVAVAGFVHDLGKVVVPEALLLKVAPLSESERGLVRAHAVASGRLLDGHPLDALIGLPLRHHHEHFDGSGYPDGLAGQEIPLAARIVAVCDAFDAMTSARPWRPALALEDACAQIEAGYGREFDQDFAERLVRFARAGSLSHLLGHSDLGVPVAHCPHCGPCVNVFRTHQPGALVYCRRCAEEFEVTAGSGVRATGRKGSLAQTAAEADGELISRLVLDAMSHLPA